MRLLRWMALATLVQIVAAPGRSVARAEDAPRAREATEVRVYPVGALLRQHPWFPPDRGPGPIPPEDVSDEAEPLFGDDSAEGLAPLGSMEEMKALLRATSGALKDWESDDVEVLGVGQDLLLVQAPRALHDAIDARLAVVARDACTSLAVDVALFEGDADAAQAGGGLAAAISAGTLRPLGIARVMPSTHGTGTARDGGRSAYVCDQDTEVGCSCNVPDPIVGVVAQGLAVQALALPTAGGRWSVRVRGFWADEPEFTDRRMQGGRFFIPYVVGPRVPVPPGGDVFEVVSVRGEPFEVPLTLEEGIWAPVALSGRRALAVRLRATRPDLGSVDVRGGARPPVAGEPYGIASAPPTAGPLAWRSFAIGDLVQPIPNARGETFRITPSNYCPPEAPTLPAPQPAMTVEAIRWILERTTLATPSEADDATFAVRAPRLAVHADVTRAAAVERTLAELRGRHLRPTEVEANVVTLPLAALPEVWSDPDAVAARGVAALLARPGATLVGTARLSLRDGQRSASVSGSQRSYLKDYDVELACTTTIGNPIVVPLRTGLSVDVRADPVLASALATLLVRVDRATLCGLRSVPTRFGPIQAPRMHEQSLRGAITLAPGETRLFGLSASGCEATLVLLSASR